jgi:hypothetical protein
VSGRHESKLAAVSHLRKSDMAVSRRRNRTLATVLLAAASVACTGEEPTMAPPTPPTIVAASVAPNPNNVLSAIVTVRARDAATIKIRFHPTNDVEAWSETPSVTPVDDDDVSLPVFGLYSARRHILQVVAESEAGGIATLDLSLTTGALPSVIPHYSAGGTSPTPGYVAFSVASFGVVIDNTGRVVWYHQFGESPFLNFQPHRMGHYVAGSSAAHPGGPFTEINPLGTTTRSIGCAGGLQTRFHELRAEADGSFWLMCDESRRMDLSNMGGAREANVNGTVIQHISAAGERLFQWNALDHFSITDLESSARSGANVNFTHGNAIDIDGDGNLLISFRALSELTKVDPRTGAVLWRMGGTRNQFSFEGMTLPAFARQHGLRSAGGGQLIILDNLGDPELSRGERYEFDEGARTVRLAKAFVPARPVVTLLGGSTQQLPGGRLLVAYGSGGHVAEYDADGNVVWQIHGDAGYVFRATRIRSLYEPVPY